ncbi:FAD-dependent oxidoreductase [Pediococcus pentosaceus]|jgi:Uncharacterized NAD(FAD)-dependent dehydrogenases|uniref:FAD-dependent oxidoreductase n=2 Tax=Pediococcus pentosaceus TaxID=1255 RepID=UPI000B4AF06E|nr:FAD-dependent oxidoreductase [Pediococcus pentosaceus]ASC09289.1 NADH oxidase (H(2)O(2)-forming) [Pediococcus pentosaceus]MBF7112868.1 FAD-dependent oxidoreductase [Pediococcus pentosaceus]MBY4581955.1 FAD-dependent oxidoreductase [Pediococcus pentosaceus]MDQ7252285.1 FAD-dependent oxidoreductase [Pediococcus pentosaceus]MDY8106598.1 FAD-dependent oxidoreductase [Pediococcus pentosaceus]
MTEKIIVVGCTHAGIAAVNEILKYHPQADVTVFERHDTISYLSCATYLTLGKTISNLDEAMYADPDYYRAQGIDMRLRHDVIDINVEEHTVFAQDLETKEFTTESFDKLIMATGSLTSIPTIQGVENPKVKLCKTYEEARDLCDEAQNDERIAIIGGGYIGVELAEGYNKSNHEVILFHKKETLLDRHIEPEIADKITNLLEDKGIQVKIGTIVKSFEDGANDTLIVKTADEAFEVDMAVICTGLLPQADLLQGKVDQLTNGAIVVNDYMETSNPDIFAAGDAASVKHNGLQTDVYMPLASQAVRQGALAGINVLDKRLRSIGTQSTTGMLIFGRTLACSGVTLAMALDAGINATKVAYKGSYRPDFMPNAHKVEIELVYDRNSRKVLGVQLWSKHDVSQAADTISALMHYHGTIDELSFIDMLFSPNFDQPFNYLNLVGQLAVKQENGYLRT